MKSKFPQAQPSLAQASKKTQDLEVTRFELLELLKSFGVEIKQYGTVGSRTPSDKKALLELINKIQSFSGTLNELSMSEGSQSIAITALHCLLIQNDKINTLLLQNASLNKRLKDLEDAKDTIRSDVGHESPDGDQGSPDSNSQTG